MDRKRIASGFLLLAGALCGCGGNSQTEPAPVTYKVEGTVLQGGKPFAGGGAVEFLADGKRAVGDLDAEGAFVLRTVTAQHNVPGACAGNYTVTILPASKDQSIRPIILKKKYAVIAGDNRLTINVED